MFFRASMIRLSSPPEAIFPNALKPSPGFGAIRNSPSSRPADLRMPRRSSPEVLLRSTRKSVRGIPSSCSSLIISRASFCAASLRPLERHSPCSQRSASTVSISPWRAISRSSALSSRSKSCAACSRYFKTSRMLAPYFFLRRLMAWRRPSMTSRRSGSKSSRSR